MLEHDVRVTPGDVQRRIQVAEALWENQFGSLLDHILHNALGIGALGYVLRLDDLDARYSGLHFHQAVMHSLVVAVVVCGADVPRAQFELGLLLSWAGIGRREEPGGSKGAYDWQRA